MSRLQKLLGVGKGYLERLPPVDVHKLLRIVLMNLPYIVIFYVGNKLAWLYQYCVGDSMIERLMVLVLNFQMAFSRILPSMHKNELLVGITGAVAVKLLVYMKGKNAKKFRQGVEYGSARWGTAKDIAPFIDPVFENNILLTMTERLTMNGRPKNPKFARNKNVIVIGGSGSGKTRFYVKPNLMQMGKYISYVVTDPKGTIIIECGKMLVRHGYKVKVLNTINFSKSMHYNPFHYIHSEKDILKLVNTIMVNTKGEGEKSSEDFWTKAERLLYCALIGYIWYEAPEEEQNFATLLEFINASETREDDETFKNAVDMLFEELEKEEPEHFAVRQYKKYKLAAGETKQFTATYTVTEDDILEGTIVNRATATGKDPRNEEVTGEGEVRVDTEEKDDSKKDDSKKNDSDKKPGAVKTGDATDVIPFFGMTVLAAGAAIVIALKKKRRA